MKHSTKLRVLPLLLAFCLVFNINLTAFASSSSGSKANPYLVDTAEELSSSLSRGGYIKLTGNINGFSGAVIAEGKNVYLDLNGYTVQSEYGATVWGSFAIDDSAGGGVFIVETIGITVDRPNASFTLHAGTVQSLNNDAIRLQGGSTSLLGGQVLGKSNAIFIHLREENQKAQLTIDGTKIVGNDIGAGSKGGILIWARATNTEATLTVKRGTIESPKYGIHSESSNGGKVNINICGGTIKTTNPNGVGIYVPQSDPLTISGSPIIVASKEIDGNPILSDSRKPVSDNIVQAGTCGANISWTLYENGVLSFTGTGAMPDYTFENRPPWYGQRDSIVSVAISDGITTIGQYAFDGCTKITDVTIPESITKIEFRSFYGCSSLKSITVPHKVWHVSGGAFAHCTSLKKIFIDEKNPYYKICNGAVFSHDGTALVIVPAGYQGSFSIPAGTKEVRGYAFWGCTGLTKIEIPTSITSIDIFAFHGCTGLSWVDYKGSEATWNSISIGMKNEPLINAKRNYSPPTESKPGLSNFLNVNSYTQGQFSDVSSSSWFANAVQSAYQLGLVKGNSATTFNPNGNISIAETLALACRLHSTYYGKDTQFVQGSPWYQVYVDYAVNNGIISTGAYSNYSAKATRAQFVTILAASMPASALPAINTVEDGSIPDVTSGAAYYNDVYKMYRAGILTGSDAKGTFNPSSNIKRSEVATIVVRMADASQRKNVVLEKRPVFTVDKTEYHINLGDHATILITLNDLSKQIEGINNASIPISVEYGDWINQNTLSLTVIPDSAGVSVIRLYVVEDPSEYIDVTIYVEQLVIEENELNISENTTIMITAYGTNFTLSVESPNEILDIEFGEWDGDSIPITLLPKENGTGMLKVFIKENPSEFEEILVTVSGMDKGGTTSFSKEQYYALAKDAYEYALKKLAYPHSFDMISAEAGTLGGEPAVEFYFFALNGSGKLTSYIYVYTYTPSGRISCFEPWGIDEKFVSAYDLDANMIVE